MCLIRTAVSQQNTSEKNKTKKGKGTPTLTIPEAHEITAKQRPIEADLFKNLKDANAETPT